MVSRSFPELSRERVAQALAGERAAVADVYETYEPAVRSAVVAAIRHRPELESELEDLVSEIWTRFVEDGCWRLRGYDPDRGSFGYYLRMRAFATARALAGRRQLRSPTVALHDPLISQWGDDGLEGRVCSRERLERLWTAMQERLGPIDIALFQGVFVEGRLVREVCEAHGLSEGAAQRRCHRLREKIERIAEELDPSLPTSGAGAGALVVVLASLLAQGLAEDRVGPTEGDEQSAIKPTDIAD